MAQRKGASNLQGGRAGCLFWLLLLCIVLLLFLVNLGKIKATLASTNFHEIVKTQGAADDKAVPPVSPAPKISDEPDSAGQSDTAPAKPSASTRDQSPPAASPPSASGSAPGASPSAPNGLAGKTGGDTAPPASIPEPSPRPQSGADSQKPGSATGALKPQPQPAKTRKANLYFVRIDEDGVIVRQEVSRVIPASDQPLTDALAALLGGPSAEELRRNLLSLIPQGTKLLSAQVRGATAYLNFNEAFMYNHYGIEGYAGQLKQIVFTATAFPSVQDVQILIEGERHDYLGGEGVYIGRPLSRNSF